MARLVTPPVRATVRRSSWVWVVAIVVGLVMLASSAASAQVRRDTTARRDSTQRRLPGDTSRVRGDSLQPDSTAKLQVQWAEPDSAMQELMALEGYTVTKFQGSRVELRNKEKTIKLAGKAAVGRPDAVLVGDTVVYNDSLDLVTAIGDLTGKDTNMVASYHDYVFNKIKDLREE